MNSEIHWSYSMKSVTGKKIIEKFSIKYPDLLYVLIKNSNFKCKNSFEDIKNPYIKAFLGFEEIEPKILSSKNFNILYIT